MQVRPQKCAVQSSQVGGRICAWVRGRIWPLDVGAGTSHKMTALWLLPLRTVTVSMVLCQLLWCPWVGKARVAPGPLCSWLLANRASFACFTPLSPLTCWLLGRRDALVPLHWGCPCATALFASAAWPKSLCGVKPGGQFQSFVLRDQTGFWWSLEWNLGAPAPISAEFPLVCSHLLEFYHELMAFIIPLWDIGSEATQDISATGVCPKPLK